jgi:conjugal transfer pilus assembly protein TraB
LESKRRRRMEEKKGVLGIIEKVKETWAQLPTEQKSKFIKIGAALLLIVIGLLGYVLSHRGGEKREIAKVEGNKTQDIGVNADLLQKTQYYEAQKQLEALKKELEELKKEKAEREARVVREEKELKEKELKEKEERKVERKPSVPPPPPPQASKQVPPPPPPPGVGAPSSGTAPPPPPPKTEVVGDIKVVSAEKGAGESKPASNGTATKDLASSKKKQVYLPPSFMEATLLSGLDAPAVGKGDAHPVPVLLRVKAPAVLPNKVKANLKGCFVIAEGVGNLASERADLRLVSLSCIDKKGQAVIDQKIKGFVVDNDGKIGLRGRVVSKMGSILARSLISGIFSGLGQAISMQGMYYYPTSGVGTIKPEDALRTTFASGIMQATANLQKFYLDLASQTIPVIEVQATRNVTLVISEGINLEIKEFELLN